MLLAASHASDPFALPAFIISIIAAVAALAALGWNVWTWRQSGARVTLETSAVGSEWMQWVNVVIRNKGRTAVTITEVLLYEEGTPTSATASQILLGEDDGKELLPFRLEPQASLEFYEEFEPDHPAYGKPGYWVTVELANGRILDSGWIKSE
ncbi:hypothetical protein [Microbacterium sp. Ag1]|uniref:hypothetical protein n=1 Tax=Microbacterium sp. Ag1 TaxID=1643443 RepID=UPI0006299FD4|nr:hypothetical protein [Microbacterium sp. Ag1]KKX98960.1 hypothetical protein AAY78_04705 [Microbacterium sp. Ag1]